VLFRSEDGSNSYKVSVYSDEISLSTSNVGIYWDVTYGGIDYTNSAFFNTYSVISDMKVKYVDVSILKDVDNGDIHSVVCYSYTSLLYGDGWTVEDFIWDTSSKLFISNPNLPQLAIESGSPGYTIHIDANNNGDFIIVYDNIDGNLRCITGRVENSISINNNGVSLNSSPFSIDPLITGFSPDVSMSNDGGGGNFVYVSFTNFNTNTIDIYSSDYPFLTTGFSGFSLHNSLYDAAEAVYTSRIASPNSNGASYEFTVVYSTTDIARNDEYIKGFNNSTANTYYYNDASSGPSGQIYSVPNRWPVVTYNSDHNVLVGWIWNNISGAYTVMGSPVAAQFPIVLPCGSTGGISVTDYWIVPSSVSTGNEINLLALSGKHAMNANEDYISFHNASTSELLTKWADVDLVSNLRNAHPASLNLQDSKANRFNDLIEAPVNFYIFDLMGRNISKTKIDGRDINIYLNQQSRKEEGVLQVYRIEKLDGAVIKTGKF
jgi:hypothetical protein